MKKIFTLATLCSFLILFFAQQSFSQAPLINSQVGFPVGQRSGKQVVYGNSKYLLLAASNYLYQSSDGSAWTQVTPTGLSSTQVNQLAFGNGTFVIVGKNGLVQSSTDGISWTTRTSGTTNDLLRVYFIEGNFFAIGINRTLLTSNDGITWTAVAFNQGSATDYFTSLSYGNGVYVIGATGSGYTGSRVYRSTTAADNSWTYYLNAPVASTMNRIQFIGDRFFGFFASFDMYSSTDGISWTKFSTGLTLHHPDGSSIPWGTGHQIFNGVWDGTYYNFYGSSQYHLGYGSTFRSTDLANFTLLEKTAYIVPQESKFINSKYFVCGNEGIVSSTDGLVYTHSGGSFQDMVKTANKYIAVGMISQDGQIYNSTDFINWSNKTPAGIKELYGAATDGTNVLAAGARYVLMSGDEGDSWSTQMDDADITISALAYGNGKYVAGGYSNSNGSFINYSTDNGITWMPGSLEDNYYHKVKYVNNRFFAFGVRNSDYLGVMLTSSDGINWTDITPDLGVEVLYYKDVAWDGYKFHFLGMESEGYTPTRMFTIAATEPLISSAFGGQSFITNVPAGVVLGGSWDEGTLTYSNGKFTGSVIDVATGQDYIIYSTNGSSWTAVAQNSYSTISAAYASGNTVRMIGRGNSFITATYSGILPVNYLVFEGERHGGAVKLKWITASEENSSRYLVQHSTDGRSWEEIGTVQAAGNSTMTLDYSFIHDQPAKSLNYYRLQQQDLDGRTTNSKTITVNFANTAVKTYPNPVDDVLYIEVASSNNAQVVIYNTAGQAVRTSGLQQGQNKINVKDLSIGIYIVEIRQANEIQKMNMMKR